MGESVSFDHEKVVAGEFEEIERVLRSTGAWCERRGALGVQHYYVAKNASLDMAASMCFSEVAKFSDLQITNPDRRCMICDLYKSSREEVVLSQESRVSEMMTKLDHEIESKQIKSKKSRTTK